MKIAVWHNLPSGGGKRALYHHVKGLLERGHTIESWCPPTADQTYLPLSELIKENIVPLAQEPKTRVGRINQLFFRLTNQLFSSYYEVVNPILAMDEHCQQCAAEINQGDFDILFANSSYHFATSAMGRYVEIPKLLYLQEPRRQLYEAMPQLPWMALPSYPSSLRSRSYLCAFFKNLIEVQGYRVQLREEVRNAQAFDLMLVNSLFSRESILRAYGIDAKVCYLGIDCELFKPTGVPRKNIVVGLGGIYFSKGLERAVRAVATIPENERPDLIWIGNTSNASDQPEIENLAKSLGVNFIPKVRISDTELVDFLNQASVMIYTPILEPFGFAPLEANACETPVVAIAEGGVRESVQDGINGVLILGNDPVALGQAISRFLKDKEFLYKMGKQARSYVLEKWRWNQAIERLEKYLLDLIEQQKAA